MNHVPRGPKKPVNMTLSEDLVRDARRLTRNLSETVEMLLANYIDDERHRQAEHQQRLDESLRLIQAHQEEFGLWGQEFSTL
jgi:antitoxin CcdA